MPHVVFECEYSQSHESVLNHVRDWIVSDDGGILAVVLVNWRSSPTIMTFRGDMEVNMRDRDGMPRLASCTTGGKQILLIRYEAG